MKAHSTYCDCYKCMFKDTLPVVLVVSTIIISVFIVMFFINGYAVQHTMESTCGIKMSYSQALWYDTDIKSCRTQTLNLTGGNNE